ncbi:MAG: carboxypeptidase-like regulatory domain-containing protein [Planctomycetaceae bacterium]
MLLVGMAIGCGKGDRPDLATVSGTVTVNGEPLSGADVIFLPAQGRQSYGRTDENGQFELTYIRDTKGAVVGQHTVKVNSGRVDPQQVITVVVEPGENVIPIECTAGKGIPSEAEREI